MHPLSGPNDISQFSTKVTVMTQNGDLYYCDGHLLKHWHAQEIIFILISPKRLVTRVVVECPECVVQCPECTALYTIPAEMSKAICKLA